MISKIELIDIIQALEMQSPAELQNKKSTKKNAAVLVPIINYKDGLKILFTKRTDIITHHPGQISFPGGQMEKQDLNLEATALRETYEEINLDPQKIKIISRLKACETISGIGFFVTPIVGLINPPLILKPAPIEVAEIFEIPFEFLIDPLNHQRCSHSWQGKEYLVYKIDYKQYSIWGLTAKIIVNFAKVIRNIHSL